MTKISLQILLLTKTAILVDPSALSISFLKIKLLIGEQTILFSKLKQVNFTSDRYLAFKIS